MYNYEIALRRMNNKKSEYKFIIVSETLEKNNVIVYKRKRNNFKFNDDAFL